MRRRNLKQAFVGEGDPNQEGLEVEQESQEDVEYRVVGGHIAFVVPAGTPDEAVVRDHTFAHAELVLENGMRITLGIHDDTVGAQVASTPPGKATDPEHDLSAASAATQGDAV